MAAALRFQTAPGGGLYGAVWIRSAGLFCAWFLGRRRELHDVLLFLRFVKFQRQRRDRGATRIGGMDRPRFMTKVVHGFTLRHARRTRPLGPGVAIGVQAASFYPQHPATPAKFAGAILRRPGIHLGEKIATLRKLIEQLS